MPRQAKRDPYFKADWQKQADATRIKAEGIPAGIERDAMLRKARQLDTAVHMKEWLESPGLVPPSE